MTDCKRPNGPCLLGPGRSWRRPITRRSNHTAKSTETSKNTKTKTALMMTIQIESPASEYSRHAFWVLGINDGSDREHGS